MYGLRFKLFQLLELTQQRTGKVVNALLLLLILMNVVAIILESVETVSFQYSDWFELFELFSIIVFTAEYLARVWVSVEHKAYRDPLRGRIRFMLTPMLLVDAIAILPFYLSMFVSIDTRILRIFRLFRVFKLTRHLTSLEVLLRVIRNELPVLVSSLLIMVVLVVLASAGIYLAEHDIQPEVFGSIPKSMWWATVTLTTVGYGDVVPITATGKIFGIFVTILGVGMAALPAGIIASGFSHELHRRQDEYQQTIQKSIKDGVLSNHEKSKLEDKRKELGINGQTAKMMIDKEKVRLKGSLICPHCGKEVQ